MWKQLGPREDSDNEHFSDDDVNKCSDDAVNVVKSKKNKLKTRLVLPSKVTLIVTIITIIVAVTTLGMVIGNPIINLPSKEDILGLSDHLKGVLTKMNNYCSSYEVFKEVYLCNELEEQNRQLKTELQKTKAEKDTFTCDEEDYKGNDPPRFVCLSASSTNNLYECVFGNRSLSSKLTDTMHINITFKLLYPEIADDGKIFLEFGLTTLIPGRLNIIIRGQRCKEEPGLCLYVLDGVWTKLDRVSYSLVSDYVQEEITLELHQSNFVLLSNNTNIYISTTLDSSMDTLYPMFGFYNTHLINISQTIYSKRYISYDGTTVDPHLFISEDNTTLSTHQLMDKRQHPSFWESVMLCIPIAGLMVCIYVVKWILKNREDYENTSNYEYVRNRISDCYSSLKNLFHSPFS